MFFIRIFLFIMLSIIYYKKRGSGNAEKDIVENIIRILYMIIISTLICFLPVLCSLIIFLCVCLCVFEQTYAMYLVLFPFFKKKLFISHGIKISLKIF